MYQQGYQPRLTFKDKFILIASIILPAIAITVEASIHVCARLFFDPIPTVWHLMLVLFVPLAQLHVWFTIRRGVPDRLMLAGFVNAIVIGISIFYSIAFLPIVPFALPTALIGVGLLPLSPLLSLIAALMMRRRVRQIAAATPPRTFALRLTGLLVALSLTFGFITLIELPATLTRHGLQMAASQWPHSRAEGIRFLRNYGSKDHMLRSCYNSRRGATTILSHLFSTQNPNIHEARQIYYRVTGETFDMSAPPRRVAGGSIPQDIFTFEDDQGGTRIGAKYKGLSLSNSILDGTIDADGGVGYLQWTLTFRNDLGWSRQVRAEIQLPPGAVVSRTTLWENNREREAVFSGRFDAGTEYQSPSKERSPVLVSTAGRDRVLVQSYFLPSFGNEMKIRLGITVPLVLESRTRVRLLLPHIVGRNFRISDFLTHSIWFESTRPIGTEYSGLYYAQMPHNRFMLGGQLTDKQLSMPERSLLFSRVDSDTPTWSQNPFETEGTIVKQWIEERAPAHLRRIVFVVDTSASMAKWEPEINAALGALPRDIDVKLVFADGEWLYETNRNNVPSGLNQISAALAFTTFAGGADNAPALWKAWNLAAEVPGNNAIVWIHSPQLVNLGSVEELRKRWKSRPYGPMLYSVQTRRGSDEIVKRLEGVSEVKSVVRMGTLRADLEQLFGKLSGRIKTLEFVRSIKHSQTPETTEGYKTSDHLAKLWANDEIVRILNARDQSLNHTATSLATRYQLVTPVSKAAIMGVVPLDPDGEFQPFYSEPMNRPAFEGETLVVSAALFVLGLVFMRWRWLRGGNFTVQN